MRATLQAVIRPLILPAVLWALGLVTACERAPAVEPPPPADWASICGSHCAGHPIQVSIGGVHTCVRYAGGAVLCWGLIRGVPEDTNTDPTYGLAYEEVDPDSPRRSISLATGILDATSLATGLDWSCVVRGGRGLWCWGSDHTGHTLLGDHAPYTLASERPAPGHMVPATAHYGEDVHRVWAHGEYKCVDKPIRTRYDGELHNVDYCAPGHCLIDAGQVWCWGDNYSGEFGTGRVRKEPGCVRPDRIQPDMPALGIDDAVQVVAVGSSVCALRASGEVWCWGNVILPQEPQLRDYENCLGEVVPVIFFEPAPVKAEGLEDIIQIGMSQGSRYMICALRADHQLLCWGPDDVLAMRTGEPRFWMARPYPGASDVVSFDLRNGLCVIRESGEVACDRNFPPFTDEPPGWRYGDLVPIRDLPDLPADFAAEPTPDAGLDAVVSDGGI